jgi:DNA-binding transcriptional MerR regulator
MDKSPDAFRTISEVAEHLDTPAHVLRFWESRFSQIRPVKRAGGRRYYRPSDVALLAGIKRLLHDEGLTIRGVQRILRDQGTRHVAGLGPGDATPEDAGPATAYGPEAGVATPEDAAPGEPAVAKDQPSQRPAPKVAAPVQPGLPLFDKLPETPTVPAQSKGGKPNLPEDRTIASLIRALPIGLGAGRATDLAAIARRLSALRTQMVSRADGGAG